MNPDITYMLAMSCVLPAIAGIFRYNKINSKYHPFIYMMILAVFIETTIYLSIKHPEYSAYVQLPVNIYMLLNFSLFLFFVQRNGYLGKRAMQWLLVTAGMVCIFNAVYEQTVFRTFFYLLCFVSAAMLIISIDILSRQTMVIKYRLANNFWFWLSSFSIIYNAFTLLIFGLYFFAIFDTPRAKAIGNIQHWANMICYIFFTVAILKIPDKKMTSPVK
ncbi:MAG: hypothetical protein QM687_04965 [Ferruginibacter sp.]